MPILRNQPTNMNQLIGGSHFRFIIKRAPNLNFFGFGAKVPGLNLVEATQVTPFTNVPRPGSKMKWDDWPVTFHVQEDLANYLEIFNWMTSLGNPDHLKDYNPLKNGEGVVSDATLTIFNSLQKPNIDITFQDIWPSYLSELDFSSEQDENVTTYVNCTVNFKYRRFYIEKLPTSSS